MCAWSYVASATPSQKDQVRDLVGDTDTADQLLSDEQINKYLTGGSLAQTNVYLAAAACAADIQGKFARRASLSAGGTAVQLQQQAEAYAKLAQSLRMRSLRSGGVSVYAGGISRSDKDTQEDNDDNLIPFFSRQMGDAIDTSPLSSSDPNE